VDATYCSGLRNITLVGWEENWRQNAGQDAEKNTVIVPVLKGLTMFRRVSQTLQHFIANLVHYINCYESRVSTENIEKSGPFCLGRKQETESYDIC
jgi:hypothetical protein